ncbi:MAG: tyrosine-type recombinase/integrase [Acidobacteria bacterium]|nr:tyrosine-type recombinase/integrase [Acidobacteriota bacterium]MBI3657551.1 tyrosine-type recombinase/integrase [Acidobacteriota bacterium]
MNPIVVEVLSALKQWNGNLPYVFPHRFKENEPRVNPDYDALHDACQKAGIGEIGFHTFRHTGASWLMAAGVDIETVRIMGGWSDYKILMRYCHTTREQKRKAANILASLISVENLKVNSQKTAKFQTPTIDSIPQVMYTQTDASVAQW